MEYQDHLLISSTALEILPQIARPLLVWYDKYARPLPWRQDPTPYHVWVSEIMLQQTRVEAVKGYYTRFLEVFPTVQALACAPEDVLLKHWEGLGYYNRARNLQRAAKELVRHYGGHLPASYAQLLSLPGIGEYTAGAIASIAFGIPVPAVDGNVLRVFSRLLESYTDISHPHTKRAYQALLPAVIPDSRPGDFNQSLMEVGATICLPAGTPLCEACPISSFCLARQHGVQLELPVKAPKKQRKVEERTIIPIIAEGKILLFRREKGLLGGMYQPLNLPGFLHDDEVHHLLAELDADIVTLTELPASKHLFTHIEWQMRGFLAYAHPFSAPEGAIWADTLQLSTELAIPSAFRAYTANLADLLACDPKADTDPLTNLLYNGKK